MNKFTFDNNTTSPSETLREVVEERLCMSFTQFIDKTNINKDKINDILILDTPITEEIKSKIEELLSLQHPTK